MANTTASSPSTRTLSTRTLLLPGSTSDQIFRTQATTSLRFVREPVHGNRVVPGYVPVDLLNERLGEHVGVAADDPFREGSDQIGSRHRSTARLGPRWSARHRGPARLRRNDRLLLKHEYGIVSFRQCIMYDGRKVRPPTRHCTMTNLTPLSELVALLEIRFDEIAPTRVMGSSAADERHHQPWGIVHGGLYACVIETFATTGAFEAVKGRGQQTVGVSNMTDFLRPHRSGRLQVDAVAIQQGRTQQLWQVEVRRSGDEKLVARGQVRLQNIDARS